MNQLANCPKCNALFVKNEWQSICHACLKVEEKQFDVVYDFLRKQKNRQATLLQVSEETGVREELILKFIRQKRIQLSKFPNLGYPCERCKTIIREQRFCAKCREEMTNQLDPLNQSKPANTIDKSSSKETYYAIRTKNNQPPKLP
ncbi:TIGR03826 family flagellar region protein [Bacillus gobiensis]|uniref:TIGR03826 family flagellar region protein n=1 Tax=Bacillus gobiensis TaxID=1441095 RepID=UPI003D1E9A7C